MQNDVKASGGVEIQVPKRNVKLTSTAAMVSVLVHVVVLVASVYIVAMKFSSKPQAVFESAPPVRPKLEPRKLEMKVRVQQNQKRSARPKLQPRMASMRPSELAVPEIKNLPQKVTKEVKRTFSNLGASGRGMGSGGGFGDGLGGGMGGLGLPASIRDRCSPVDRMRRLQQSGGTPACETAVVNGLRWLAANQNRDGSWGSSHKVGMTGLALLAFLGHCETPDSEEFGKNVVLALEYMVRKSNNDNGFLRSSPGGHFSYEHGIATYALGEAHAMTKDPGLQPALTKAIAIIVNGQASDGGWDYTFGKGMPSDTSVSGWMMQALKAAHLTGLNLPGVENALSLGVKNILRVQGDDGSIGYRNRNSFTSSYGKGSLDGVGAYSLQIWKHGEMKYTRKTLSAILEHTKNMRYKGENTNLYKWYYDTLACFQRGGTTWSKWNNAFQKEVLNAQLPDGSWPPTNEGSSLAKGGGNDLTSKVYRTCINILMLEVYYRYLAATS